MKLYDMFIKTGLRNYMICLLRQANEIIYVYQNRPKKLYDMSYKDRPIKL